MNYQHISIRPATDSDCDFAYEVKKRAEGEYVSEIFGWDEAFQIDFHNNEWRDEKPQIIEYNGHPIGTISVRKGNDCCQIGRFFIDPRYQSKGIGTHLLGRILTEAEANASIIKLAFLKNNPVKSLYERLGFKVVVQKGNFIYMEKDTGESS